MGKREEDCIHLYPTPSGLLPKENSTCEGHTEFSDELLHISVDSDNLFS